LEAFKLLQSYNKELKDEPSHYWSELNEIKSDVKANLDLGCRSILIKDFKEYLLLPQPSTQQK